MAELKNVLDIACSPETIYAYVTQPWRWREWHPNSLSATAEVEHLEVGDGFDEEIEVQPLSPLPINLRRQTRYKVEIADEAKQWQVRGQMSDGWLRIRYDLVPTKEGTRFTRTLSYQTQGISRLLMPLLARRMKQMSALALENLKCKLECEQVQ